MTERKKSLSEVAENFVRGILSFAVRYILSCRRLIARPRSFQDGMAILIRRRKLVPPLTFLLVGCFLFSVIIDSYPEGWQVYFNWIWLDQEIGAKVGERGTDLFSLTSIVRAGLPMFLSYVLLAWCVATALAGSPLLRPRSQATILYAFGFHAMAFSMACLLPIIGANTLDNAITDSFIGDVWNLGLSYFVIFLVVLLAVLAVITPVLAIADSARGRAARGLFRPKAIRVLFAIPTFFICILVAAEFGSLPTRFGVSLKKTPTVSFQAMGTPELLGSLDGTISQARFSIVLYNITDDLAYVDANDTPVFVSIVLPDGTDLGLSSDPSSYLLTEDGRTVRFLAIPPDTARYFTIVTNWEHDESIGMPTSRDMDGTPTYDGVTVHVTYDLVSGAEFSGELDYSISSPSVAQLP